MSKFLYPIYNLPNEFKQDLDVRELPLYLKWWLYKKSKTILPKEYKQVECIQSTGTQYIDTGFIPNQDSSVMLDFEMTKNEGVIFFGARTFTTFFDDTFTLNAGSTPRQYVSGYYQETVRTNVEVDLLRHIIYRNKNLLYLDNALKNTAIKNTFTCPGNAYLFACNQNGSAYLPASIKLYACKIWNNDVLVRDFIPCYRKADNEVGLYDLVSKTFFTNSGTGNFIVGSNAPQNNLQSIQLEQNLSIENNEDLFEVNELEESEIEPITEFDEIEESEETENNETDY